MRLTMRDFDKLTLAQQDAWREYVRAHGVNPDDVYQVDVDDNTLTAHRYASDADGKRIVKNGEIAKAAPITVARAAAPPTR